MIKDDQSIEDYMKEPISVRVYTPLELQVFHDKLQKYYYEYTTFTGEKIRVLDLKKAQYEYGAIGKNGGVILDGIERSEKNGSILRYARPAKIEQWENLIEQYNRWQYKKGYGEQKKLEELDKLAESMRINQNI